MNKERKHIVFLARWYPHRYDPMFGLFVQRHAEAAALFNDITAIYCHACERQQDNKTTRQQASKFEIVRTLENNVDTIRVYYEKPKNKILSLIRFYRANMKALKLQSHVETHRRVSIQKTADLIHVHILTRLGVIAWIQKLLHKTPYIITEHWSRYLPGNDFGGFLRKMFTKIVVRNAETVTTVTENLAIAMKNHGLKNDNYVVLPNVVNLDMFHISERDNNPCKIIHISCFEDKSKNISGLLESLKMIEEKGIDFQCTLIGEGMDLELMKEKAKNLQLINKVSFTGLMEGQKLADELSSGDFLVLSSNYENMPVVILEALASGLPVVSTNVGGIKEMIDESKGILVEPRNKEALAEAMIKMIETHKDYDANYLRNSVIEKYGYESVGRFLSGLYSND